MVEECSLPYTGREVVGRVITDLSVLDVTPDGLVLTETAPGVHVDEIQAKTGPHHHVTRGLLAHPTLHTFKGDE